jgi:BASS family bile acid:Na+ symporter
MDWALDARAHFGVERVATLVLQTILIPLAAGMLLSRFLPARRHIGSRLVTLGLLLLIAGALPLLILGWRAFDTLSGNGAMAAIAIFVVASIAAGHLLGGPRAEDRTALAMATSARHPGLAIAIAQANFPEQSTLVAGAIVIYLILRLVLSVPYLRWLRPVQTSLASPYGTPQPRP